MIKIKFLLVAASLLALVSCSETVNTIEVNKPSKEWEYEELEYSYPEMPKEEDKPYYGKLTTENIVLYYTQEDLNSPFILNKIREIDNSLSENIKIEMDWRQNYIKLSDGEKNISVFYGDDGNCSEYTNNLISNTKETEILNFLKKALIAYVEDSCYPFVKNCSSNENYINFFELLGYKHSESKIFENKSALLDFALNFIDYTRLDLDDSNLDDLIDDDSNLYVVIGPHDYSKTINKDKKEIYLKSLKFPNFTLKYE